MGHKIDRYKSLKKTKYIRRLVQYNIKSKLNSDKKFVKKSGFKRKREMRYSTKKLLKKRRLGKSCRGERSLKTLERLCRKENWLYSMLLKVDCIIIFVL